MGTFWAHYLAYVGKTHPFWDSSTPRKLWGNVLAECAWPTILAVPEAHANNLCLWEEQKADLRTPMEAFLLGTLLGNEMWLSEPVKARLLHHLVTARLLSTTCTLELAIRRSLCQIGCAWSDQMHAKSDSCSRQKGCVCSFAHRQGCLGTSQSWLMLPSNRHFPQ